MQNLFPPPKQYFTKKWNNTKQTLINNGFHNYIVDEQIESIIKNVRQQYKHCNTPSNKQEFIKLFYRNQMNYNYKLDENILKTFIQRNILLTDPNKNKTYHILYQIQNLQLSPRYNSSPSIGVFEKKKLYINLNALKTTIYTSV